MPQGYFLLITLVERSERGTRTGRPGLREATGDGAVVSAVSQDWPEAFLPPALEVSCLPLVLAGSLLPPASVAEESLGQPSGPSRWQLPSHCPGPGQSLPFRPLAGSVQVCFVSASWNY